MSSFWGSSARSQGPDSDQKRAPKVKHWRPLGQSTSSSSLLNSLPNVRLWRLLGKHTSSIRRSKLVPKVRLWRPLGKATPSMLWLKRPPKVRLCKLLGKFSPCMLWSKRSPNVRLWRLSGRCTPFRLWLNQSPSFKLWSLLGKSQTPGGSGWTTHLKSDFQGHLVKLHFPTCGWSESQQSISGGCLETAVRACLLIFLLLASGVCAAGPGSMSGSGFGHRPGFFPPQGCFFLVAAPFCFHNTTPFNSLLCKPWPI